MVVITFSDRNCHFVLRTELITWSVSPVTVQISSLHHLLDVSLSNLARSLHDLHINDWLEKCPILDTSLNSANETVPSPFLSKPDFKVWKHETLIHSSLLPRKADIRKRLLKTSSSFSLSDWPMANDCVLFTDTRRTRNKMVAKWWRGTEINY